MCVGVEALQPGYQYSTVPSDTGKLKSHSTEQAPSEGTTCCADLIYGNLHHFWSFELLQGFLTEFLLELHAFQTWFQ